MPLHASDLYTLEMLFTPLPQENSSSPFVSLSRTSPPCDVLLISPGLGGHMVLVPPEFLMNPPPTFHITSMTHFHKFPLWHPVVLLQARVAAFSLFILAPTSILTQGGSLVSVFWASEGRDQAKKDAQAKGFLKTHSWILRHWIFCQIREGRQLSIIKSFKKAFTILHSLIWKVGNHKTEQEPSCALV